MCSSCKFQVAPSPKLEVPGPVPHIGLMHEARRQVKMPLQQYLMVQQSCRMKNCTMCNENWLKTNYIIDTYQIKSIIVNLIIFICKLTCERICQSFASKRNGTSVCCICLKLIYDINYIKYSNIFNIRKTEYLISTILPVFVCTLVSDSLCPRILKFGTFMELSSTEELPPFQKNLQVNISK